MNKKIKGYEVMKLIAEKQIKEGQEFLFTDADGVEEKIFWNGENLKYSETERDYVLSTVGDVEFAVGDFEILEDEEKIEEIKVDDNNYIVTDNGTNLKGRAIDITFVNKINKIIKKVNELDKKINKE